MPVCLFLSSCLSLFLCLSARLSFSLVLCLCACLSLSLSVSLCVCQSAPPCLNLFVVIYIFSALEQTHCALVRDSKWVINLFITRFRISIQVVYICNAVILVVACLVPSEVADVSAHVLYTPYNRAPVYMQCYFVQSHMLRVHVCLALTCHLHFWQNDGDLLRASAVTQGWNGHI